MEMAEKGAIMDIASDKVWPYSQERCRTYFGQLVDAVDYCKCCQFRHVPDDLTALFLVHQRGFVHRGKLHTCLPSIGVLTPRTDIKPDNLLLTRDDSLKLIDFGSAAAIDETSPMPPSTSAGTPAFMAPELLRRGRSHHTPPPTAADVWSMGITLYCLAYGRLPFEKPSLLELYEDIRNNR